MTESDLSNTTIKLADKHRKIADKKGLNLSKWVRNKLEELE